MMTQKVGLHEGIQIFMCLGSDIKITKSVMSDEVTSRHGTGTEAIAIAYHVEHYI